MKLSFGWHLSGFQCPLTPSKAPWCGLLSDQSTKSSFYTPENQVCAGENIQCCCSKTRHCWIFVKKKKKKRLLPLDTCCKHSTRSRCRGTGWPKAGRKWSSRKSSSGPLATQLTNPQLLRYNCRSCTGQQLSSWAVSLVKPIQRWKVNAHTRGFAGATPPARQLFSACLFVQIQILFGKNSKAEFGLT